LLVAACLFYPVQALTVRTERDETMLRAVPVAAGSVFRLSWIHTVSRRLVTETYAVDCNGSICLNEMVFDHEGPNLPAGPNGVTTWHFVGNGAVVTGYVVRLDRLHLAVAPFGHYLETGRQKWDIVAGAGPDRSVRLAVERIPLISIFLEEALDGATASTGLNL
jgi:hypothetical protein